MPVRVTLFLLIAILTSTAAIAQDDVSTRMSEERIGYIRPGAYEAGDKITFTLNRDLNHFLLRFANDPEIYVLYDDHASLGGRILRYDSGATAIHVSGWGAITLYTDSDPSGLPAERTGDSTMPAATAASLAQVQTAANDEAQHLAYARNVHLSFSADWQMLGGDPQICALAFDALQNAARGIERFADSQAARAVIVARVDVVHIAVGGRPLVEMRGRTLNVTFNPERGFFGRASSRGIARGLNRLFSLPIEN